MKDLNGSFDLAVADHIFEHVSDTESLAESISMVLCQGGYVHIGIPDATNFTDRFYRLIHRDGGGHISQFTKDSMIRLMDKHGFDMQEVCPWPDDWRWFDSLYSLKNYQIDFVTQEEVKYIADVFRKELTPEKGYFYGWEFIFKKR